MGVHWRGMKGVTGRKLQRNTGTEGRTTPMYPQMYLSTQDMRTSSALRPPHPTPRTSTTVPVENPRTKEGRHKEETDSQPTKKAVGT
jgi:hypothetical protein